MLGGACLFVAAAPGRVAGQLVAAVTIIAPGADVAVVRTALAPLAMLVPALAGFALLVLALRIVAQGRRPSRAGSTWGCGYPATTPRMQYTSTSFASGLTDAMRPSWAPTSRLAYRQRGLERDVGGAHGVAVAGGMVVVDR